MTTDDASFRGPFELFAAAAETSSGEVVTGRGLWLSIVIALEWPIFLAYVCPYVCPWVCPLGNRRSVGFEYL